MSWLKRILKPLLYVAVAIIAIALLYLAAVGIYAFAFSLWTAESVTLSTVGSAFAAGGNAIAAAWGASAIGLSTGTAASLMATSHVSIGFCLSTYVVAAGIVLAVGSYVAADVLQEVFVSLGLVEDTRGTPMRTYKVGISRDVADVVNPDDSTDESYAVLIDPNNGIDSPYYLRWSPGSSLSPDMPTIPPQMEWQGWSYSSVLPPTKGAVAFDHSITSLSGTWITSVVAPPDLEARWHLVQFYERGILSAERRVLEGSALGVLPISRFAPDGAVLGGWRLRQNPQVAANEALLVTSDLIFDAEFVDDEMEGTTKNEGGNINWPVIAVTGVLAAAALSSAE